MKRVLTVVGARPQFVKAAVIARQLRQREPGPPYQEIVVHTGQHYDDMMSDVFFRELEMQPPARNLDVGSHAPASQIALMLERLDPVVVDERPDAMMVYGDTNSTLAAAIVAMHRDVPLIHVEAGERIFRRADVPEEANRVLTDHASSLCLTSTQRASSNLRREGMGPDRVRFVGDPMYDLFYWARSHVGRMARVSPASFGLVEGAYHLATIHRVQNTSRELLLSLFDALDRAAEPVLLPVHPRVRRLLDEWHWKPRGSLQLTAPLGYFDFLTMLLASHKVVTDSGGVTREAFFARRPCIIPMQNSWWTEIVEAGWAIETGDDPNAILDALESFVPPNEAPDGLFGDGQSGEHIVQEVEHFLGGSAARDGAWHPHGTFEVLPRVKASAFTHRNYRAFLARFQDAGYYFAAFEEAPALLEAKKPFVLLRHDVDLDLGRALGMAELEASMGVHSTYFLLLRTNHYNALSAEGSDLVRRMLAFGHHLGLHFDVAAYPRASTAQDLAEACARETDIMERWFGKRITMVSYHRPSALVLTGDPAFSAPLPHTYMEMYTKRIRYMSDSRGQWREGDPTGTDTFFERKPLHVLVHPIWWGDVPASPYQALQTYVGQKQLELERSIARNSASYRVGWLAEGLPR